jgi:hypothetical protein
MPPSLNFRAVRIGKKVTQRLGFSSDRRNDSLQVLKQDLSYFTDHWGLAQSMILGCQVPASPEPDLSASFVWLFFHCGKIARENHLSA